MSDSWTPGAHSVVTNLDRYKSDLCSLIRLGEEMDLDLILRHVAEVRELTKSEKGDARKYKGRFEGKYQVWYTESHALVKQLVSDRLSEFENLYKGEGRRKGIDSASYCIQDWMNGIRAGVSIHTSAKVFDDFAIVAMRFRTQLGILQAVERRFESSLFDIRQIVRADLFDSELEGARELARKGFVRAAGAISGVIVEKHLAQVTKNHSVTLRKVHPTISDFNDLLKSSEVVDVPTWRFIQRLGDLRNLCSHNKGRDPTSEEVAELIDGTDKLIKTLL